MADLPEVLIFIIREVLTDKSEVFNIKIGNIQLPAVTEQDATDFAEGFKELIETHTSSDAGIIYD